MCFDPVSLSLMAASTALQAGGGRLNQLASNKAIKRSVAAEQGRQKGYQQQADQQFQGTLDRFRPENNAQQTADATKQREEAIGGNMSEPDANSGSYQAMTSTGPEVVKSSLAAKLANAVAQSKGQAQRLAKLGAPGQVGFDNALDLNNTGMKLGTISNFSAGSKNANMAEQAAAAQKRSGWGDVLGLAGQGLSMYNAFSAPGRTGQSIFGGELKMPAGQYGPGQYSPNAGIINLF